MIDFTVARDKLTQFQTVEDLVSFFRGEKITGRREAADSCIIARWMQEQTREVVLVSAEDMWIGDDMRNSLPHNAILGDFISNFDDGEYPDLEDPCYCI